MAIDGGLRKIFSENLPQWHWTSIETGSTGRGIPDSHFCFGGVSGWIEYKVTAANAVGISPEQVAWAERYCRAGGRHWLAVRRKKDKGPRSPARDELHLYPGQEVRAVLLGGLEGHKSPRIWAGGPKSWDWAEISKVLQS